MRTEHGKYFVYAIIFIKMCHHHCTPRRLISHLCSVSRCHHCDQVYVPTSAHQVEEFRPNLDNDIKTSSYSVVGTLWSIHMPTSKGQERWINLALAKPMTGGIKFLEFAQKHTHLSSSRQWIFIFLFVCMCK